MKISAEISFRGLGEIAGNEGGGRREEEAGCSVGGEWRRMGVRAVEGVDVEGSCAGDGDGKLKGGW